MMVTFEGEKWMFPTIFYEHEEYIIWVLKCHPCGPTYALSQSNQCEIHEKLQAVSQILVFHANIGCFNSPAELCHDIIHRKSDLDMFTLTQSSGVLTLLFQWFWSQK